MWQRALNYPHLWILLAAWFTTLVQLPLLIRLAHRIGAVDRPRGYKGHAIPTPFLGGVAIFIAFTVAILTTLRLPDLRPFHSLMDFVVRGELHRLFGIVIGAFFILLLGLLDDFRPINAFVKLLVLLFIALFLHRIGLSVTLFPPAWDGVNVAISVLWMAGVTSAMNSLDHMDGNCAGAAAVSAFFCFAYAWDRLNPQPWLSYASVAVLGGCLGFLQFNFKPAQIFLGNSGAFLLGFLLAALTLLGGWGSREEPLKAVLVPMLLVGVPLYDITLATLLRYKNRVVGNLYEAIVYCGRDHLSHRLVALGLSERAAVIFQYVLGCLFGMIALSAKWMPMQAFLYGVGLLGAFLVGLAMVLDRAKLPPAGKT